MSARVTTILPLACKLRKKGTPAGGLGERNLYHGRFPGLGCKMRLSSSVDNWSVRKSKCTGHASGSEHGRGKATAPFHAVEPSDAVRNRTFVLFGVRTIVAEEISTGAPNPRTSPRTEC